MLQAIKDVASDLGKSPSHADYEKFREIRKLPGSRAFSDRFGSWANAVRAAGFETRKREYTLEYSNEELIQQLENLKKKLGRNPNTVDIIEASRSGEGASYPVFKSRFGNTLGQILEAAGLDKD